MSAIKNPPPPVSAATPRRMWVARHKFLTALGVLLVLFGVGFYAFGWPLVKLRFHSQYAAALDEIRRSDAVKARLGEPIEPLRPFPGGGAYDSGGTGEARLNFPVGGPKDSAEVAAVSRMRQGQWDFVQLKLTFPDKQELDLMREIQLRQADDTPRFDPNAKQPEMKLPDFSPDITLPKDLPSGQGK